MIEITAADGHVVPNNAVLQGSDWLVVMSHGITTGKDEDGLYTEFAEQVLAPLFDSIRFDFRGHGESAIPSNQATVAGELLDLMAVMKWARESGHRKIFHLATSFGASVTLLALSRFSFNDVSAVVFWNPVISYRNTFIHPKVAQRNLLLQLVKHGQRCRIKPVQQEEFVKTVSEPLQAIALCRQHIRSLCPVPELRRHPDTAVGDVLFQSKEFVNNRSLRVSAVETEHRSIAKHNPSVKGRKRCGMFSSQLAQCSSCRRARNPRGY